MTTYAAAIAALQRGGEGLMALVDEAERLGQQVESGELPFAEAAHLLQQYSDDGLTLLGAERLLTGWRTARARYTEVFDRAHEQLERLRRLGDR